MNELCMTKEEDVDDEDSIHRFVKNYLFYLCYDLMSLKLLIHFENLGSHICEKLYCVIDLVYGSLRFVIIYVFNGWGWLGEFDINTF